MTKQYDFGRDFRLSTSILLYPTGLWERCEVHGSDQTRMKLNGDSDEHWQASWRDLSIHLPRQPVVLAAAMTTQRVSLWSTPWPRHRPPSRRRIANDWHSTHTSLPFVSRLGQSAVTASTLFFFLPTDALEQDRRTSVSSNCIQYLRTYVHTCGYRWVIDPRKYKRCRFCSRWQNETGGRGPVFFLLYIGRKQISNLNMKLDRQWRSSSFQDLDIRSRCLILILGECNGAS